LHGFHGLRHEGRKTGASDGPQQKDYCSNGLLCPGSGDYSNGLLRPGSADAELELERIARDTGATQREARKFNCATLLKALVKVAGGTCPSLTSVAIAISVRIGGVVSKQAVHGRLTAAFAAFMRLILQAHMSRLCDRLDRPAEGVFEHFGRVLLQDSTVVKLPEKLADDYPGARNQTDMVQSAMKLQTVFDLKADRYASVELSGFRRNDQAASPDILEQLQPGDLIIRDLGYFVLAVFRRIGEARAYFLSRLMSGTAVLDPETGQRLDLLKLLRREDSLDIDVLVGAKEKLPARLVARRIPSDVADERRRKARANRDKRLKNAAAKMALLDWEIFITNVPRAIWEADTAAQVYGFRWRIEILFKAWKSHMLLCELPQNVSATQVRCLALARVLNAVLFHSNVWSTVRSCLLKHGRHASILKTAKIFTGANAEELMEMGRDDPEALVKIIVRHCAYEKRRRLSHGEIFEAYSRDGSHGRIVIEKEVLTLGGVHVMP